MDLEELRVLTSTLNAFKVYEKSALMNLVCVRRKKYEEIECPAATVELLQEHLDQLEECIKANGYLMQTIASIGDRAFNPPQDLSLWSPSNAENISRVHSTIRQIVREWSDVGARERQESFGKVLKEVEDLYAHVQSKADVRVLVPGCGLGRLPFEFAARGFSVQGNEFSFHMLAASNLFLNYVSQANEFRLHPFIHTFSHQRSRSDQLRAVLVPDVCAPQTILECSGRSEFSMIAGSFEEVYPHPIDQENSAEEIFDVVVSVFFIDTSPNIYKTLQALSKTIRPGGHWVNFGPLLWHYEEIACEDERSRGLEMCLEDLLDLIPHYGFKILKRESAIPCSYTRNPLAMAGYVYECEYWVAVKL